MNVPTANNNDVDANHCIDDDTVDSHRDNVESNVSHHRGVQLNAPTSNVMDVDANCDDTVDIHRDDGDFNVSHRIATNRNDRNDSRDPANRHSLISPRRNTLAVVVRTYKAAVTTFCRRAGYTAFQWQRSYYERIIRDDAEWNRIRQYIIDNPTHWNKDEHYPHH